MIDHTKLTLTPVAGIETPERVHFPVQVTIGTRMPPLPLRARAGVFGSWI